MVSSEPMHFGYVRQMDLFSKEVRIRADNDSAANLVFLGRYDAKVRDLESKLKLALRLSEPVQFAVEGQRIVKVVNVPMPE